MQKSILALAVAGVALASCGSSYESFDANWKYQCNSTSKQTMIWKFNEGEPGQYDWDGGSVFKPVDPADLSKGWARQDGTVYDVSGNGDQWVFTRRGNNQPITCKRDTSGSSTYVRTY